MGDDTSNRHGRVQGILLALLAVAVAAAAWWIPARWRSLHPGVIESAGRGTPGVADLALLAANQQRLGLAGQLLAAAQALELSRTNEIELALGGALRSTALPPEARMLGGPDPAVAALFPALTPEGGAPPPAFELFLPPAHRTRLRESLGASRSPGVQALLGAMQLPVEQFVPAAQPGGQPYEAVVLLAAALYERERLSASLATELRDLPERAAGDPDARRRLEGFYLNLLTLARRLDWTSLAELTRKCPDTAALEEFTAAVRQHPEDLPVLYAAALLSGEPAGLGRHCRQFGDAGHAGLVSALREGSGAVQVLARDGRVVQQGLPAPAWMADAVRRSPSAWQYGRTALMALAAVLAALSVASFSVAGTPRSTAETHPGPLSLIVVALVLGGFLVLASEPLPVRSRRAGPPVASLDPAALNPSRPAATSAPSQRKFMEPTTLVTLVVFGVIQMAVYVICVRKIGEISRLPEPASVRLRLLENEENLFDSGLYVGIGGTALALAMQVLQMVEANLLAAYSSNLMGIICVAAVKIGHVRKARRALILEGRREPEAAPQAAAPAAGPATVTASNPFTFR
ncbi:MAG: hypothetical protein J0L84_19485 [Verrucomicrobia bacterium]|nr:hypothetical protein [Verrucomicrobiota bacterium]